MRLTEIYKLRESSSFAPNTDKIDSLDVEKQMPEAWTALQEMAIQWGYEDLSMFIFDTDGKGNLWAINDHNLWWDGNKWTEHEGDEPPHWSNSKR